jgi:hypothetical protein
MVCSCVLYNASIIVAVGIVIIMIFVWYLQRHERFLTERFSSTYPPSGVVHPATLSDPLFTALQHGSIRTEIYNADTDSQTSEKLFAEIRVV